jgi:cobalt/nickel transport system permease protein
VGTSAHSHAHASPADGLYLGADTPVHRLLAHGKLVGLIAFVLVVVATPTGAWTAYAGFAVLLALVVWLARIPLRVLLKRMVVEIPFVVFALLMPFVATGPRIEVLGGVTISQAGLVGGATVLAKATLVVVAAIVLAATTSARDLLAGLDRLHLPKALVAILSFMVRYASVVVGDLQRMRVARESRGYTGGGAGHLKAVAAGAGALFVRSYERGERVHLAMLARGYTGRMPALSSARPGAVEWLRCLALPFAAVLVLVAHQVLVSAAGGVA